MKDVAKQNIAQNVEMGKKLNADTIFIVIITRFMMPRKVRMFHATTALTVFTVVVTTGFFTNTI